MAQKMPKNWTYPLHPAKVPDLNMGVTRKKSRKPMGFYQSTCREFLFGIHHAMIIV
jgi:hypothetical protein